jgi:hypothetical protein
MKRQTLLTTILSTLNIFCATVFIFFNYRVAEPLIKDDKAYDVISYANQVGRLDIISILLAFFGILIGVLAAGWFIYVRNEAREDAVKTVKEELKSDWAIKLINEIVGKEVSDTINKDNYKKDIASQLKGVGTIEDKTAEEIIKNIEG